VATKEQETLAWLYDLSRETLTRFSIEGSVNQAPVWTPDGKRIALDSNKVGPLNICWGLADGSSELERLTSSEYVPAPMSWSPDGQLLAFVEYNPTTQHDIWVLRMGDRKAQPFLRTRFDETEPRFSPDGRWLAYISDESGRYEIYVQPYPGPGREVANLDGRRHGAGVEPERAGAVLPQRKQDDGRGNCHSAGFHCRHAADALRGSVRFNIRPSYQLRCLTGRPALPDGQARRAVGSDANQHRAELVRRAEAPCPDRDERCSG
jgi:hypothetical protein